ncbi:MAG: hypothetical protein GY765_28555 [bacterium]|nr:hypothetical protein [bacterium]
MFKSKTTIAVLVAVMILVMAVPVLIQAAGTLTQDTIRREGYWTCASIPYSFCRHTTSIGCRGEYWSYNCCNMTCRVGNTSTPTLNCHPIGDIRIHCIN